MGEPARNVIDIGTAEHAADDQQALGLYTPDGILFTSEIQCKAMQFLMTIGHGVIMDQAADAIRKVVHAMSEEGAEKGSVTIKLDFKVSDEDIMKVKSKVTHNIPVPVHESSYFADKDLMPSRDRSKANDDTHFRV